MTTWTIKSQTDDPKLALSLAEEQRNNGCNAWIEDENGNAVDEENLKRGEFTPVKPSLQERAMGLLIFVGGIVAGLGTLYLIGLWIDHD